MVRLQPRQKPLLRSSVQMPMHGDMTRLSGGGPSPMTGTHDVSGFLAQLRELVLQLVELALEIVDRRVADRRLRIGRGGRFLSVGRHGCPRAAPWAALSAL